MSWFKKTNNTLASIVSRWKSQGVTLFVFERDNIIVLDSLIVPKGKRKQGIGSQIMRELTEYADTVGKRLELSPGNKDPYHGTTSRKRLIDFYKRFGLIQNKGRHKDYRTRETMYREPTNDINH